MLVHPLSRSSVDSVPVHVAVGDWTCLRRWFGHVLYIPACVLRPCRCVRSFTDAGVGKRNIFLRFVPRTHDAGRPQPYQIVVHVKSLSCIWTIADDHLRFVLTYSGAIR